MKVWHGLPEYSMYDCLFFDWEKLTKDALVFWHIASQRWEMGWRIDYGIELQPTPTCWEFA